MIETDAIIGVAEARSGSGERGCVLVGIGQPLSLINRV